MKIELTKNYEITGADDLTNRERELILMLTSYQHLTGLRGNQLINEIIDILHPITSGKDDDLYNAEIVRRCRQRKRLKKVFQTHLV